MKERIRNHISKLSDESRKDIAHGRWDEVMTDALYAACGAVSREEMSEARRMAEEFMEKQTKDTSRDKRGSINLDVVTIA